MSYQDIQDEALKLPIEERENLAQALFESVTGDWSDPDISESELERRLHEMRSNPAARVALHEMFPELAGQSETV